MGCHGCEIWGSQRKTCYAGILHTRFGGVTPGYSPSFEKVTLFPGRMAEAVWEFGCLVGLCAVNCTPYSFGKAFDE